MNNKGQITIFFTLLICVLMLVVSAVIESTRIISSKTNSKQISDVSLDACFSKYAKELYDKYGVFGLWKDTEEVLSEYNFIVNEDLEDTKDFFGIDLLSSEIKEVQYLTENNGENFAIQVDKLMQYKVTQDIINAILLKIKGLENTDVVDKVLDEVSKYQDIIISIDEDISIVYENVEILKQDLEEVEIIIDDINKYLEEILSYSGKQSELLSIKGQYEECVQRLSAYVEEIESCIDKVYQYEKDYEQYTTLAEKGINSMNEILSDIEDECNKEVHKALTQIVEEYDEQIVSLEKDYFNMVHCGKETEKIDEYCSKLLGFLNRAEEGIKDNNFTNEMGIEKFIPDLIEFEIFYDEAGEKEGDSILNSLKKLFSKGFLSLVVDDVNKISDVKIDTSTFVSARTEYDSKQKFKDFPSNNEIVREILFSQYVFDYFDNYLSEDNNDKSLKCEIEYIIAGKNSDRKNMENIVNKLIAIREGLNMAYIVTDKEKMLAAEGMAASIVGITGITPLVIFTKWLVITGWVTAESVVDVKFLLQGESIGIIKTKNEWYTDLGNLNKFNSNKYKKKEQENSNSMKYKDYLRLLLFTQNSVKQVYRTMDLVELNISKEYNEKFKLSECIYNVRMEGTYRVKQLFNFSNNKKTYNINIFSEMQY